MNNTDLILQLKSLPNYTGVYEFFDIKNNIIYVGKAKNLKKRILQYFQKKLQDKKTQMMVSKIYRLKTIILESEFDALLLENNLIKNFKPKYNILLRDDKAFPWIVIKNEFFPRVSYTRMKLNDKSEYFGPYTNYKHLRIILELIHSIYPIRSCNLDLNPKKIQKKKFKLCLEYHLKNCKAPCENLQSHKEYMNHIRDVHQLLKGNFSFIRSNLEKQMIKFSNNLEFEKAQQIKDKITALENYHSKSIVINSTMSKLDVFSIVSDNTTGFVNYIKIRNGAIIQSFTQEYTKTILNESDEEILIQSIVNVRQLLNSNAKEILTHIQLNFDFLDLKIIIPKVGDKKKIVNLSLKNAKEYRLELLNRVKFNDDEKQTKIIMRDMKKKLYLNFDPLYIECFDNSNLCGTYPVSACVVFRNGKPSKKEYRIFNLKTLESINNDCSSMEEVLLRRYSRLVKEHKELPQLIIIDGGKGQLSSSYKILCELNLQNKIAIISITKPLEAIYFPNNFLPLYLNKFCNTLRVIKYARDEAHRFGNLKHQNLRINNSFHLELEKIFGFGEKTIQKLFQKYKSIEKIKKTPVLEIEKLIGKKKQNLLFDFFKKK